MEIYSWNVNGIRAVKRKGFLDWLAETKPDILGLQEIRIQPEQLTKDLKEIDGYYTYFNCGEVKGYSGVAIYTKEEPESVEYGIGVERFDREGRVIIAHYPQFTLLNIYFPNGRSSQERLEYKLEFYEAILDYCEGLREEGKSLIVCGDYNTAHQEIDLKNPEDNRDKSGFLDIEREWIDRFIDHGYIDTFRYFHPEEVKYSWWSYRTRARERNAGWRIDYHFVSENLIEQVKGADVLTEVMGSDHCPVFLELENG
ncbi:exodeoxyribonuclease III [Fuchsiella alkaliacetigena]|uniref:exodeoxyribonuclease III n=1 Tax=Fuchsiella alkaliacetigena TaxID=957042 RepID=UPI00200B880C|nr:exodeoxyribonuclease III [Fuchsiella alkaliacetigena]MCK8825908.1 exodeoxyribonuclease III [Fuchsiella alkaliacetigena]